MMEVLCISEEFGPHIHTDTGLEGERLSQPKKGDILTPINVIEFNRMVFYEFQEHNHQLASEYQRNGFEAKNFSDITSLQEQIDAALKAPKPAKKVYRFIELGYDTGHELDAMAYLIMLKAVNIIKDSVNKKLL